MKLSNSFSGALRTFEYFIASGTHYQLEGMDYLELFGEEPGVIEQAFAIYVNVMELDSEGNVLNAKYAEKRAVDYIKSYCDPYFKVEPPYEYWEINIYIYEHFVFFTNFAVYCSIIYCVTHTHICCTYIYCV